MDVQWLTRAGLYELLAQAFRQTTPEFSAVVQSGEFGEALEELAQSYGFDEELVKCVAGKLAVCSDSNENAETYFHRLRQEYTRVFIGGFEPIASPYAGIWWATKQGVPPVHMINAESLAVAQAMHEAGIVRNAEKNVPLDGIVSELEFLQYLCAQIACGNEGLPNKAEVEDRAEKYQAFYDDHFLWFAHDLGSCLAQQSESVFYCAVGMLIAAFPTAAR